MKKILALAFFLFALTFIGCGPDDMNYSESGGNNEAIN